jgi:hypothetical protein
MPHNRGSVSKKEYTKRFLSELGICQSEWDNYYNNIWVNTRKNAGGLRLSGSGYMLLSTKIELDSYEIPIQYTTLAHNWSQTLLDLDKFCPSPYYIKFMVLGPNRTGSQRKPLIFDLILFDSVEASLLTLSSRNLDIYLDMKKRDI